MDGNYRNSLPQLSGELYLTDAGLETDLIFNRGVQIREFAAHTLLLDPAAREVVAEYFRGFLSLAKHYDAGFILDTQTWKAHLHWADALNADEEGLREANRDSVAFVASLRREFAANTRPIVLNGLIGPRGDGYAPDRVVGAAEAEDYHSRQIGWLACTDVDMVTATTFSQSSEAVGVVRAARAAELPVVVSFTVDTDGFLPSGQSLMAAIQAVDDQTAGAAAYFMVNCAHPDHFFHLLTESDWARRILGLRCNASRLSHAQLDECQVLDDGNPVELGDLYQSIANRLPWLNVFGGCCGTDLRHVAQIARSVATHQYRTL